MLHQQVISFITIVFISNMLLASCQTQTSVSNQELSEQSKSIPTNSSSVLSRVRPSLANYKTYDDTDELESTAELIIVGKPQASLEDSQPTSIPESEKSKKKHTVNESVVVRDEQGFIVDRYTITPVKVQKVLKGKVEEKEIKVLQPAAVVQESSQPPFISLIEDYSPLKKNTKYLLFLKEVDTATYPNLAGVYSILSVNQGKFNFDKTDAEEASVEGRNEQYRQLKEKVKKKYEALVNAVP